MCLSLPNCLNFSETTVRLFDWDVNCMAVSKAARQAASWQLKIDSVADCRCCWAVCTATSFSVFDDAEALATNCWSDFRTIAQRIA